MNIVDVIIILFILMMGVLGLKRGFFKELVMVVGTIVVFFLSFLLKNPVADVFCLNFPFFDFKGTLQGATSLSIVFYQLLAFLLIAIFLFAILRVLTQITGIFEKILKFTIILGIPSKILGFLVGLIEGVVVSFLILVVLAIPLQGVDLFMTSEVRSQIVMKTPILKDSLGGVNQAVEDIYQLTQEKTTDATFNYDVMNILLKYKVVKPKLAKELVKREKIDKIPNINELIKQYEEEEE